MRDDFNESIKRIVAERVGHLCSRPECRALTSGPQNDSIKSINIGVAAHITAASKGGPRFDPKLTSEQRKHINNAIWLCQNCAKLIDNDPIQFPALLLYDWKSVAETTSLELIGKAINLHSIAEKNSAKEVVKNIELKKKMREDFLKKERQYHSSKYHSYEKFKHNNLVIHSIDDKSYPNLKETNTISGWFRVEPWDFYHNGLEIVLSLVGGIMDEDGNWAITRNSQNPNQTKCREISIWVIGRIPWENIVTYDLVGDEYYNEPHIYCAFSNDGTPYENIVYRMLSDDYDWPLKEEQRFNIKL